MNSVMIRVRCGWKPAPPQILHQTLENEPPMRVACDIDRVGDILDELKVQGVDKAEICLVGWNVKGHDGRWPQALPVCEELGFKGIHYIDVLGVVYPRNCYHKEHPVTFPQSVEYARTILIHAQ